MEKHELTVRGKQMLLITKEIAEAFEKQGSMANTPPEKIPVICKLFNPCGAGTWYLYEREKNEPDVFWCFVNLGDREMAECGTVSISEMAELTLMFGLGIERDKFFNPGEKTLQEVIDIVKNGGHV